MGVLATFIDERAPLNPLRWFLPSASLLAIVIDWKWRVFRPAERRAFLVALALASILLYVSSIGLLPDVYRLGFHPLPIAIAALAAIGVAEWSVPIGIVLFCAIAAFDLHLLPSRNLIDYLVDPLSAAIAVAWCASRLLTARRARRAGSS